MAAQIWQIARTLINAEETAASLREQANELRAAGTGRFAVERLERDARGYDELAAAERANLVRATGSVEAADAAIAERQAYHASI